MLFTQIKYYSLVGFFLFLAPFFVSAEALTFKTFNFSGVAAISSSTISTSPGTSSLDSLNLPWEWRPTSNVYQYSFSQAEIYDKTKPLEIKIAYDKLDNNLKQIFSFNETTGIWNPLVTKDEPGKKYVTATTTILSGKLVLLSSFDILSVGTASWYKYKNGMFAASPDYKKGSVLRVTNLSNNKSIEVTINDWGPERVKHPDRVIDLDKVSFKKLAPTGAGLIKIKVEPIKVVVPDLNKKMPQNGQSPNISALGAIVMTEKDGKILWEKNSTVARPLASLTKLVAIWTFLAQRPSLNQVIAYKIQDENYNYQYCKPGESARLKLKEGETLTLENLVYSALVGSANNAVETLVRASGLSRPEFIKTMNQQVKTWGATSTIFSDPTGLDPKNVSSPYDYAIITKEVFLNPLIKKISVTNKYKFSTINTKKPHSISNTNSLLRAQIYPIVGSKTGYLDEAGYCLMTRVKTVNDNLIIVNFGSTSSATNLFDNEQLIRYGLKQLSVKK